MSDALTAAVIAGIATVAVPGFTLLGIWLERRIKHKTADAALETAHAATKTAEGAKSQADAALESAHSAATTAHATAEAAVQDAFTRAYEAATKNFGIYLESVQKWCESQSLELAKLGDRLSKTEMSLEAERMRANKFEHRYRLALIYLQHLFSWIAERFPGEALPSAPAELKLDIDRYPYNAD